MPSVLERPKMTRTMYQALKRHIVREREKKKQEQEHDEALERMRKERELRKKKEQEDSLTLEQTKDQIAQLETKLETLKQEKHELFSQLKKVLHHEDETRKRAQLKEQSELISLGQHYPHSMAVPGHSMFIHGGHMGGRPTMYKSMHQQHTQAVMAGIKRQRSPSPPPAASMYQPYTKYQASASFPAKKEEGRYVQQIKTEPYTQPKAAAYPVSQTTHVTYVTQPGHTYQQTQAAQAQQQTASFTASQSGTKYTVTQHAQQAGNKFAPGSSAFTSYPSHYAHQQKQIGDPYQGPYPVQRLQQPGYLGSPHAGSLQQQLEHANQKSGFVEEKFKLQQQSIRGMSQLTPQQQQGLVHHQIQLQQQQQQQQQQSQTTPAPQPAPQPSQQKGSIVTGYPVRTQGGPQQSTTAYQAQSTQGGYAAQQASSQRPPTSYGSQTPGRYY